MTAPPGRVGVDRDRSPAQDRRSFSGENRLDKPETPTDAVIGAARLAAAYSRSPASYALGPCLTKRMHCPWFLKPNRRQPPCLHCLLLVGTRATGLTATSLGPWPVATV